LSHRFFSIFIVLSAILSVGCSHYTLGRGKRILPGGYDRLAVPMFNNKTQEVGIEKYFTEYLRTEFERSRIAHITSTNDAQVIVEGTIVSVTYGVTSQILPGSSDMQTPNPISPRTGKPYPRDATTGLPVCDDPTAVTCPGGVGTALPAGNLNPLPNTAVLTKQYSVTTFVHIEVKKVADQTVMWRSDFSASRQYLGPLLGTPTLQDGTPGINSSNALYNQSSRDITIGNMARDMMSEAHDRLTENF